MIGTILAWQGAQVSFFWAGVNFFQLMILISAGTVPSGASAQTRLCSSLGPWQASQLIPGSRQVLR